MDMRTYTIALTIALVACSQLSAVSDDLVEAFRNPPAKAGTVTLWWLNGELTEAGIREQMLAMRDQCGFSGVAPLTMYRMKPSTSPKYLSEEYFEMYGCILDTAKELGMSVVFYDDCDFPSGTAGNQMAAKYPDDLMKYLARATATVHGPGEAALPVPSGTVMSVVAKNLETGERHVVTAEARAGGPVSSGVGGSAGFRHPPEEEGRFGRSPEALYPALWEDIGPDTAAARANLYALRNELFAAGYPRAVQEWCDRRGMTCSGHPAASYRANPLQSPGDAMLFYKYQGAPLTDYIHYFDHGIDGFKVPASAAYNYDRPKLVCEIYGNFHQKMPNDSNMLYRAGMEVYARGINFLLPHGTWWDPAKMRIVPEISWRNPEIGPELPRYNRWAARCETLLRAGRHVADIGVLYPIDDLAARYHVGLLPSTHGKDPIPGSDYYELSRLLTGEVRRDFTFLHPEIVDKRCRVDGNELLLENRVNWERYRVVILPACRTIRVTNLAKIRDFMAAGGHVIATTCLPEKSAEFGRDADVQRMAQEMFGPGGKGVFVPRPDETTLQQALDGLDLAWDVRITDATDIPRDYRKAHSYNGKVGNDPDAYAGGNRAFAYLHRAVPGAEAYFFANAGDLTVSAKVELRGRLKLETWDPHTGSIRPLDSTPAEHAGKQVTRFDLSLAPIGSLFVVAREGGD